MSNVTFNQLPAASALTGTEVLPVNQVSTTKQATTKQISDYVASEISGDFATVDHNHTALYEPVNANIQQHIANTNNPHGITADQVIESVSKVLFTPTERTKLSGIATGAEVNVNTDWDSTSGDSQLINKPTINVSAGVYVHPSFTDNLNGSCTVGSGQYILYNNAEYAGESRRYTIAGGTFTLTDNNINYIIADYNAGTPVVRLTSNLAELNDSSNTPIFSIFRIGTNLHVIDWGSLGNGLPNKLNVRTRVLSRFEIESGFIISETPTRVVSVTAGTVWYGGAHLDLPSAISTTDPTFLWTHVAGAWVYTPVTQYNNTQYDNGTNAVSLSPNRYAVNWIYRGVYTSSNSTNIILGRGDYTLADAVAAPVPTPPPFLATTNVLVGRIIVQVNLNTATQIDQVTRIALTNAAATSHADLLDKTLADQHPASSITNTAAGNIVATNVQAAINELDSEKIAIATKGIANGVATLDGSAKIPAAQLPDSIVGQVIYKGVWNANTNTPTMPAATSTNKGWYYIVSVSGSTSIDGITDWKIGDWCISDGVGWTKVDNTDSVSSVFGRAGAIVANSGDYTADQITESGTKVFVTPTEKTAITHSNRSALDLVSGTNTGDQDLSGLEPDLGNPSIDGQVLSSTTAGVRSWITSTGGTIEGETVTVSETAPTSPNTDDLWLDITDTTTYPILAQGNLIEKKTITTNTISVSFTGLNSTVDGIYTIVIDIMGAATSDLYIFMNGDTTPTNYYRELIRASGVSTLGILNSNEPSVLIYRGTLVALV